MDTTGYQPNSVIPPETFLMLIAGIVLVAVLVSFIGYAINQLRNRRTPAPSDTFGQMGRDEIARAEARGDLHSEPAIEPDETEHDEPFRKVG